MPLLRLAELRQGFSDYGEGDLRDIAAYVVQVLAARTSRP